MDPVAVPIKGQERFTTPIQQILFEGSFSEGLHG